MWAWRSRYRALPPAGRYGAGVALLDPLLHPSGVDRSDAVTVAGRTLSSGALVGAASALAARIAGASAVAVDADASLETVVATVAGLLAGVPVVPVPPDAGPLERSHILDDSGADLLLTTPGGAEPAGPVGTAGPVRGQPDRIVERIPVDVTAVAPSRPLRPASPAPALILYTSGTTGPPKGVVIGADAVAADLDALAVAWDWTADDVLVHGLPLFHVHGLVLGVLGALRTGARLVHTGRPTPAAYLEAVAGGGTLLFGVPTVWSRLASAAGAEGLRPARLLVSGSASLPVPVIQRLRDRCGHTPIERYGMTETLITVSARARGRSRPGTVGTPLPGVSTRLVGEDGGVLPADGESVGSLQVQGPTMMEGYLNLPEATAASSTADGWFVTGDAAVIEPDGAHRIVGRESTDLIKTGGYRVGAGEVENALLGHPGVREAAVVGVPDDDLGQTIVAYVVAGGVSEAQLIDWVANGLSVHKRPRRVILVDGLPRNAMGKVQKRRLAGNGTDG
jgi:fatty acid CoA ligase FadD36